MNRKDRIMDYFKMTVAKGRTLWLGGGEPVNVTGPLVNTDDLVKWWTGE